MEMYFAGLYGGLDTPATADVVRAVTVEFSSAGHPEYQEVIVE
jgi:hypothetical protein